MYVGGLWLVLFQFPYIPETSLLSFKTSFLGIFLGLGRGRKGLIVHQRMSYVKAVACFSPMGPVKV